MKNGLLIWIVLAVGFAVIIAFFFFDSIFGLIPGALFGIMILRKGRERLKDTERQEILSEFGTLITVIAASLSSGRSLENAFLSARQDMRTMYEDSEPIMRELMIIERKISMGTAPADALTELADRTKLDEIRDFAGVLKTIEKSGGNTIKIIKKTSETITSRIELKEEIEVMVAGKRLEQTIMTCMPFVIVMYLRLTNGSFLNPLYKNPGGILVMCGALTGIAAADYIGGKITKWNTLA